MCRDVAINSQGEQKQIERKLEESVLEATFDVVSQLRTTKILLCVGNAKDPIAHQASLRPPDEGACTCHQDNHCRCQSDADHPHTETLQDSFDSYGVHVRELRFSNGLFVSITHEEIMRLNDSMPYLESIQLHDLRDDSTERVMDMLVDHKSLTRIKFLHGFLSETCMNKILQSLMVNLHKPIPSNVQDDIYGDLEPMYNQQDDISQPYKKHASCCMMDRLQSLSICSHTLHMSTCHVLAELIKSCNNLQVLELSFNHLDANMSTCIVDGLRDRIGCAMRKLTITENDMNAVCVTTLVNCICSTHGFTPLSFLTELDLSNNYFVPGSLVHLFHILHSSKKSNAELMHLQMIKLNMNDFNDQDVNALCLFLASEKPCSVRSLSLNQCCFNNQHCNSIMKAMRTNVHLLELDISENSAFHDSLSLAQLLLHNHTLKHLNVSYMGFEVLDVLLERALVENRTLQSLNLNGNRLGDEGAALLSNVIRKRVANGAVIRDEEGFTSVCFSMALAVNRMYDAAFVNLANALECKFTDGSEKMKVDHVMKCLDVSGNFFSQETVNLFRDSMLMGSTKDRLCSIRRLDVTDIGGEQRAYELCDNVTVT
ncbi:hypothetical protein AKO1_012469 [Acrasis kona]|uniref:Uncharacterized protein n=1 Tax=Acrasis kona TaxID=1008807 RepID=A0AAW2YXH6_9EUKA